MVAPTVREKILKSEDKFWRPSDFSGSRQAVLTTLSRMCKQQELLRVRRGLYWRGRTTSFGPALPNFQQVLREVIPADAIVAVAGIEAANLLRLSTQVSPRYVRALSCRVPTGLEGFAHPVLLDRSKRSGRKEQQLSDLEATLLEGLEAWDSCSELSEADTIKRFIELFQLPEVRSKRLQKAAATEPRVVQQKMALVMKHF